MTRFTPEVEKQLGYYVYRLIDPRNGRTFYVGKGKGNRVFAHVHEDLKAGNDEDSESLKLETLSAIRNAGLKVLHVVHRHGMDENTALEVEAALIDAIPGLDNAQAGHRSNDHGPANVIQLAERYGAVEIEFDQSHRLLLIKVGAETVHARGNVYEAVRWSWRLNRNRAASADYVLGIVDGICKGVFVAERWIRTGKRWKFEGRDAPEAVRDRYIGKRIPASMRKKGMATPTLYWPSV